MGLETCEHPLVVIAQLHLIDYENVLTTAHIVRGRVLVQCEAFQKAGVLGSPKIDPDDVCCGVIAQDVAYMPVNKPGLAEALRSRNGLDIPSTSGIRKHFK